MTATLLHNYNLDPVSGYNIQLFVLLDQELKLIGNFFSLEFNHAEKLLTLERGRLSKEALCVLLKEQKVIIKIDGVLVDTPTNKAIDVLFSKTFIIKEVLDITKLGLQPQRKNSIVSKLILKVEELSYADNIPTSAFSSY
jgi:hypothetical protein